MPVSRRTFLARTATAALAFPAIVRGLDANAKLQVAVVGCSGQGFADLAEIGAHEKVQFTGFCDADTARFGEADKRFPGVAHFQDYREMFAQLGDKFDAVQVSTPDHWHARIALAAMRAGKHVYCQKPLAHTVWEARQMRLAAEKARVITQMGNQIHSAREYRTAVQLLRAGVIGRIGAVHSWIGNKGNQFTGLKVRPAEDENTAPPATLNWDLWLGPAPVRPYVKDTYAPFKWRDWQDFGGGGLGDFGCHILDPVFTALDLTAPLSIRVENTGTNPETWAEAETVSYVFPGTTFTTDQTLPVTWYDGGRQPDLALAQMPADKSLPGGGSLFIGEGGTLVLPHVGLPALYPADKFADFKITETPGANHYHAWVDAVLAGTKTTAGFHYAGPLAEAVQLGNIATRRPGQTLAWDAAALKFSNAPEADQLLTKDYRRGYEVTAE